MRAAVISFALIMSFIFLSPGWAQCRDAIKLPVTADVSGAKYRITFDGKVYRMFRVGFDGYAEASASLDRGVYLNRHGVLLTFQYHGKNGRSLKHRSALLRAMLSHAKGSFDFVAMTWDRFDRKSWDEMVNSFNRRNRFNHVFLQSDDLKDTWAYKSLHGLGYSEAVVYQPSFPPEEFRGGLFPNLSHNEFDYSAALLFSTPAISRP